MGTILASAIVDDAESILQDTGNVRWGATELLGWLNAGQREIVLLKPDASVTNASVQLAQGTKQAVPTAGVALIAVRRNMGAAGSTAGKVISLIDMALMDAQDPDWHLAANEDTVVLHYMFDERDPKVFYVTPPQTSSPTYVEMVYVVNPTDVAIDAAINLDDIYETVLLDYILYRAYQKDTDIPENANRSLGHYQAFISALRGKDTKEATEQPVVKPRKSGDA